MWRMSHSVGYLIRDIGLIFVSSVYCCKEHQVQDWKNHKLECYQFQQHKKKDNQISGVSANQHVQSELEIAARMWKQRSNGNKELRGEEAEIVVEEVMQSIVQQTLTEHNLERVGDLIVLSD